MQDLWDTALASLRSRLSEENFQTWLEPVQLERVEGRKVVLRIPNRFYADWISTHYLDLIFESLRQGGLDPVDVEWLVDDQLQKRMDERAKAEARAKEPPPRRDARTTPSSPPSDGGPIDSGLNPKYRFDNFIVGPSNQLAHAASVAAASSPGTRYNPLFIYGGVGLGKTHLVNAIGHRILQDRPNARVLFLSAERFTNEFIWALQNHRINEFRERYRTRCDVLCIDDIQFLAGREQTQEEFFHTFNAL
ncbi:MAG TPA: DnaA/Hda family protein, partial [Sandaracinaceae bacterium]